MPGPGDAGDHALPTGEDILANGIVLQGRYEIQSLIHSGGIGHIYAASDIRLRRRVVVKQFREQVKSGSHLKKLEQQARGMSRLSHTGLAMILDHFTEKSHFFLVLEYVPGKTLADIFEERCQKLSEAEVVEWMMPVCDAVSYIHKHGVVHQDISPNNIMLTSEGRIKLIDFGTLYALSSIAGRKAGKEGQFGFTPPEQWQGNPLPQSDDFSIGATIYYLLTGFLPVSEGCRSGGKPQPSDYSPEFPPISTKNPRVSIYLQTTLQRALQAEPSGRHANVDELKRALAGEARETIATTPTELTQSGARFAERPAIQFDHTELNFGNVTPGTKLSKTFRVCNRTGTLTGKVGTTEPWIKVSPQVIDATDAWEDITVAVDSSFLQLEQQTTGYINIESNAGTARVEIRVTASNKAKSSFKAWMLAPGIVGLLVIIGIVVSQGWSPSPTAPPPVPSVSSATSAPVAPSAPVLNGPANNSTNAPFNSTVFTWLAVPTATKYRILIAKDAKFSQIVKKDEVVQTSYTLLSSLDPDTKYYWCVQAWWPAYGDWSADWSFTTIASAPSSSAASPLKIVVNPVSGIAGTIFSVSCDNLDVNSSGTVKVILPGSTTIGTTVFVKNYYSGSASINYQISTYGFEPGHYICRVETTDGKLLADTSFDVTGTKHVIFEDDFSNFYSGWFTSSTTERTFSYETIESQPIYQMKSQSASWTVLCCWLEKLGLIGDCVIEVDCWAQPGDMASRGIIFHVPANSGNTWSTVSFDAFGVSSAGSYALLRVTNGTQNILLPYVNTETIRTKGLPNHLKVAIKGSNIETYINGFQVATFNDPHPIAKGYVGMAISNAQPGSPVFFDNFVVYDVK